MSILIINQNYVKGSIDGETYQQIPSLSPISKWRAFFRSFHVRAHENNIKFYFNKDITIQLMKCTTVILFDCMGYLEIMRKIERSEYIGRKILYYWNPCDKISIKTLFPSWEIWTFDPIEAKNFGFKYGGQFMPYHIDMSQLPSRPYTCDLYFVGINKGRFPLLDRINSTIGDSLILNFRKVSPIRALISKEFSNRISYAKCLEEVSNSKGVLDITQKNQSGLTLRVLESFFLNKKLVSTNPYINNYSFYSPDRIYKLTESCISGLETFLKSEVQSDYNNEVTRQYTFEVWLKRIIRKEEMRDYNYG